MQKLHHLPGTEGSAAGPRRRGHPACFPMVPLDRTIQAKDHKITRLAAPHASSAVLWSLADHTIASEANFIL